MIMGIGNFYDYDIEQALQRATYVYTFTNPFNRRYYISWGTPTNIDGDIGLPGAVVSGNWTTSAKYYGMPLQVWHKP